MTNNRSGAGLKPTVFALHGGGLSAAAMRRDMGDPPWVDCYVEGDDMSEVLASVGIDIVLIGYSLGGSRIGELSQLLPSDIVGAVLYESPLLGLQSTGGNFPVLWIRNQYRSTEKREREFSRAERIWSSTHPIQRELGEGRHVRWRFGWPPFGHAWDRSLNPVIADFIFHCGG